MTADIDIDADAQLGTRNTNQPNKTVNKCVVIREIEIPTKKSLITCVSINVRNQRTSHRIKRPQ